MYNYDCNRHYILDKVAIANCSSGITTFFNVMVESKFKLNCFPGSMMDMNRDRYRDQIVGMNV